ncbi:hypothetical protein [Terasakiella sp.]|uniref:hypothetical protein n=1 Tax=Terasakiella sp. TaxID=2034861 RepID=UPI003AA9663A
MNDWLLSIGSFFAGVAVTYLFRSFFLIFEERNKRFDEICELISATADIGSEYWLLDGREKEDEAELKEAQLIGKQYKIQAFLSHLSDDFWVATSPSENEYLVFADALTGGAFQVKFRPKDKPRSIAVQQTASELVISIRSAKRIHLTSLLPF